MHTHARTHTHTHTHIRKKGAHNSVLHTPFKTLHGAPGYYIHISDEKKKIGAFDLSGDAQSGQCMTSKYRESDKKMKIVAILFPIPRYSRKNVSLYIDKS